LPIAPFGSASRNPVLRGYFDRLGRIKAGCDPRRLADVINLLIAVRLATA
jgi:hypothetical protein